MLKPKNIVGPQVSRLRVQKGWSQQKLATKCQLAGWNVSRSIIAAIEGRVRWVGDFELVMIARVLGANLQALLPGKLDTSLFKTDAEM